MSFSPRLVALDIDGTIVDNDGRLLPRVRDAIRSAAEQVPVVLTTGRAWLGTKLIIDEVGLPAGPVICSNGAQILRFPPLEIVHEVRFDPADTIEKVLKVAPNALVAVQDGVHWRVSKPFPPGELTGASGVETLEELSSRSVTRVVIRDPESDEDIFLRMASSLGLHGVSYYVGWSAWMDIAPLGVDKAQALERVCGDLGIDRSDVLAVGDGRNDIELLEWAGRGVAMGQAPAEVASRADDVTDDVVAGGLAVELERWFGE